MKVTIRIRVDAVVLNAALDRARDMGHQTVQLSPDQYRVVEPNTPPYVRPVVPTWLPKWATEGLEDTEADTRSIRGIK